MNEALRLAAILAVVCLVSAGALAITESHTAPIRAAYAREKARKARLAVMPRGADRVDGDGEAIVFDLCKLPPNELEILEDVLDEGQEVSRTIRIFRGYDDDGRKPASPVGYALRFGSKGFSSEVSLMVGVDAREKHLRVAGIRVLYQAETPGLGAEMETVAYGDETAIPAFLKQFRRKTLRFLQLGRSENGMIDGITGSTVSSRAVLRAVRAGIEMIQHYRKLGPKRRRKGRPREGKQRRL